MVSLLTPHRLIRNCKVIRKLLLHLSLDTNAFQAFSISGPGTSSPYWWCKKQKILLKGCKLNRKMSHFQHLPSQSWTWGCWAPVMSPAGSPSRYLSDTETDSRPVPGREVLPLVCTGLRQAVRALCPLARCYWATAAGRTAWSVCRWGGWLGNAGSPLQGGKKMSEKLMGAEVPWRSWRLFF